jgi:hypothetical protein
LQVCPFGVGQRKSLGQTYQILGQNRSKFGQNWDRIRRFRTELCDLGQIKNYMDFFILRNAHFKLLEFKAYIHKRALKLRQK